MKPAKIKALLADSLKNGTVVEIRRPEVEMYPVVGVVKGLDKWVLVAAIDRHFQATGFEIVRLRDVESVKEFEYAHIAQSMAQKQGTHIDREPAVKFDLSSSRNLATSVLEADSFVGVSTYNHENGHEVDAYPGRIAEIRNRILALHRLTARGRWDMSPLTLPFSEISKFSFDSVRLRLMEEHGQAYPQGPSTVVDWTTDLPALLQFDANSQDDAQAPATQSAAGSASGEPAGEGAVEADSAVAAERTVDPRDDFLGGLR